MSFAFQFNFIAMKRRNFIKIGSAAGAISLLPSEVFALFNSMGVTSCPNLNGKKLVLIQLSGANDGINTIVPINQYDVYANLRPNIRLSNSGANGIINLDTTLPLANQVGLHPVLTGFKSLYDSGLMRIIQGVGYPAQDKSHFKSTDLWFTAGDGTTANNNLQSGWVGRFLENYYANYLSANFPLGIQLGSSENSLGFHGAVEHGMSVNINGQDPSGFYSVVNGLGGVAPTNIPNSEYGDLIQFILNNDSSTYNYSQAISAAFNAGTNSITYPDTPLASQLKSVARFISGGLETKVYLVKLGGFDTHNVQVESSTTSHIGQHADLLIQVSEAVNNFITDLNNQTIGDDVLAITFSEFGRKAGENGNLGTDHGQIAPMFVFGNSVSPGVSGTNINLSEATSSNNYQVETVQHDFRSVFGTILQDWFGVGTPTLDATLYDHTNSVGFAGNKVPNLINAQHLVAPECYSDTLVSVKDTKTESITIYPNPCTEKLLITSTANQIVSFEILTLFGQRIVRGKLNNEPIDVSELQTGSYFIRLSDSKGKLVTRKFTKI